jgi:dephospho-CoA kinase
MTKQLQIIGLAGTNGSGKDSVGHILAQYHNYLFVSVTELLRAELTQRKVPITRESLRALSAEWRQAQGDGVLIDMAMHSYQAVKDKYAGIAIASLRHPGEADRVHALGGLIVWVDADQRVRYDRVQANAATRGRPGEDNETYEQFQAEEAIEMNSSTSTDGTVLNMAAVKEQSDTQIDNSGSDLTTLHTSVEKTLNL